MKKKIILHFILILACSNLMAAEEGATLIAEDLDTPTPGKVVLQTDELLSPETTGSVSDGKLPVTGNGGQESKDELFEILAEITTRFESIKSNLEKLEKRRTEDVRTGIYNTSEDGRLDFEDQHEKMIAGLTQATDLARKYRFLTAELNQLAREISGIGTKITADMRGEGVTKYRILEKEVADTATLCQRSLDEVTEYRSAINDTLIETVHRYHVRNDFRFYMGAGWFICFLVLAGVSFSLFKKKILVPQDSSSLQLVAMVMIIFVVMLFGITDVIGENGVTGILAAIAGYILGKSSSNDSVPRGGDGNADA